jgi:hypothetical protein
MHICWSSRKVKKIINVFKKDDVGQHILYCKSCLLRKGSGAGGSNGNDIEAKRNKASILRHFLYRRETNKLIPKLGKIEAKCTQFSPCFAGSKRKRTGLIQNFTGTK